jgi:AraC-like DNA-binding protein
VPDQPRYIEVTPGPPLSAFVRRVWCLDLPAPPGAPDRSVPERIVPERIVPDGCGEIVLTLDGALQGSDRRGDDWSLRPRDVVVGQMRGAVLVQPLGAVRLLGIRLHPASLPALVGYPATDFTDRVADLRDVAPALGRGMRAALRDTIDPHDAIERIVHALTRQVERCAPPAPAVAYAVDRIRAMPTGLTVGALARELGWSERRLQRSFAAHVGIGPRLLGRITRVQRAILRAEARPGESWAAVAAHAGYADQPHLVRDFADLAGCLPSAIRAEPARLRDRLLLRD